MANSRDRKKKAEELLAKAEEHLREALGTIREYTWTVGTPEPVLRVYRQLERMDFHALEQCIKELKEAPDGEDPNKVLQRVK